jgi:hypothetical protein
MQNMQNKQNMQDIQDMQDMQDKQNKQNMSYFFHILDATNVLVKGWYESTTNWLQTSHKLATTNNYPIILYRALIFGGIIWNGE